MCVYVCLYIYDICVYRYVCISVNILLCTCTCVYVHKCSVYTLMYTINDVFPDPSLRKQGKAFSSQLLSLFQLLNIFLGFMKDSCS